MENYTVEDGISIKDIFIILKKNIIVITLVTVIFAIIGLFYTNTLLNPTYQTSSSIVVAANATTLEGTVDYDTSYNMLYTVVDLITEDIVLKEVVERLPEYEIEEIKKMLDIELSDKSFLIKLTLTSSEAEGLDILVDTIVDCLITVCTDQENVGIYALVGDAIQQTSKAVDSDISSSTPSKILYLLIFIIIGGILSCTYAFIKEMIENKFNTKEDVEKTIKESIVGVFQDYKELGKEKSNQKEIIINYNNKTNKDAYINLMTNIKHSSFDKKQQVIMITSSQANELKSTTITNLAMTLKDNAQKVVVLDLDLHRPILHKVFKVERENGVADYVEKEKNIKDIIKSTDLGIDIVTAGNKLVNTLVLLESDTIKEIINKLREMYDYILIDSPPCLLNSECCIISKYADGVVFNIAMESTKKKIAATNISRLKEFEANIIGVCLTKYNTKLDKQGYYYYNSTY